MENVTAYTLAIIGGGFTVVGALITAIVAYWLTIDLESFKERNVAIAKLRAAFAPALAQIYIAQKHGDHNRPSITEFIRNNLLSVASAIEEFRPFAKDGIAYQKAWERYRQLATEEAEAFAADHECGEEGCSIANAINHILYFAKN
jgi:hypothetical protein